MAENGFRLGWCPIDTDRLFSSAWFQHMEDFQRAWYLCLLLRSWEYKSKPCHLPNRDDDLWILAGAPSRKAWDKHAEIVKARFTATDDGKWIYNESLLQIYQEQLAGYERRKAAGSKGGNSKASNARAMLEQCLAQTSISISSSSSSKDSKEKEFQPDCSVQEATQFVFLELGVVGMESRVKCEGAVKHFIHKGLTGKQSAEKVVERWREYDATPIEYKCGKLKFLEGGLYTDEARDKWAKQKDSKDLWLQQRRARAGT